MTSVLRKKATWGRAELRLKFTKKGTTSSKKNIGRKHRQPVFKPTNV